MTRAAWVWVLAGVAALYGFGQSNHDLWLNDEPRDAGIAWEMAETGDVVVPSLNGKPFLEKPPLSYAAAALSLRIWPGRPEVAVRIPSALFCMGALLCTAWIGWRLKGWEVGLAAAAILGTSREFLTIGHECLVDAGLFLWVSLAVAAGLEGDRRDAWGWWILSAFAMGLAFLTKGAIGIVIPAAALGLFLVWERGRSCLKGVPWIVMGLVTALLAGAWLWALRDRGMLGAYWEESVRRMGSGVEHSHAWYYYLTRVFEDFAPWSIFLPLAAAWLIRRGAGEARSLALPILWFAGTLVLLSIPESKRGIYLIPAFPALAILTASMLVDDRKERGWDLAAGGLLVLVAGAGVAAALAFGWRKGFRGMPELAAGLAGLVAAGGVATAIRRRPEALATAAAGLVVAWAYVLSVWAPRDDPRHSVSAPLRAVHEATGKPPLAGLDLSEPVRGAAAFTLGRTLPMLKDHRELAAWLSGGPALALVQGVAEGSPEELRRRLEEDPALADRFTVIHQAKLHHEVLLWLASPARLPDLAGPPRQGGP